MALLNSATLVLALLQASPANAWPQWSPDGARIVFASTRDAGDWEIYTMRADGSDTRRLTRSPGRDAHPVFLPDGRRIVFQSPRGRTGDQVDLYLMNADGANPRRLVDAAGFNGVPVPSPDGRWIVYQRGVRTAAGYHWQLFLVDTLGGQERPLTAEPWSSQVPSWSPDGRRLVFHADPEGRDQLFVLDVGSGAVRPLGPSDAVDNSPAWSPDGRAIAFVSTRGGSRDVYRLDLSSGAVTRLTVGLEVWGQPSWSPDGRRIAFSAKATGVDEVYVMAADGIHVARLTGLAEALVLVALSGRDSVVALDAASLARLFAVPTGPDPHEVVVAPHGRRAFVANTSGASITVIDLVRRTRAATYALSAGADPHDLAVDLDGRTLWVTVAGQRALLEVDTNGGRVRRRWTLPAEGGWMVDAGAPNTPVVVAHLEGGGLSLLDRASGEITFVPLAAGEIEAVLSPDGNMIWSSNMTEHTLTVSAVATRTRQVSFPSGGRAPVRVLLTPDGKTAAVAHASASELILIDTADPTRRSTIVLPQRPKVLAVSSDGRHLYVGHPEPGGLSLIDVPSRTVLRTIALHGTPDGVAVTW